jgi:3-dehydroquinate synthase
MNNENESVTWVDTTTTRYPIYIGETILTPEFFSAYFPHINDVLVVTDDKIGPLYLPKLKAALGKKTLAYCEISNGEKNKTFDSVQKIIDALIHKNAHRDTYILTLGGGVVGDVGGFVASCYQRGIPFVQIPTSLLAHVDASVGGKTGFNYLGEKNVIGSFYQPEAVVIDLDVIDTLPQREYTAGLAEVIKCALLGDGAFFHWLEENIASLSSIDKSLLKYVITRCCEMKAKIVGEDEKERGIRAILNLGHTFGHAIESVTEYEDFLHGEAVSIGLYCSALLSYKLGDLSRDGLTRVDDLLTSVGLPKRIPKTIDLKALLLFMTRDKKVTQSTLNLVLLKEIGNAYLKPIEDLSIVREVLEEAVA